MGTELLTKEQLVEKLPVIFQEWPLYRKLHYTGVDGLISLPAELKVFCPTCDFETSWSNFVSPHRLRGIAATPTLTEGNFHHTKYRCKNCGSNVTRYFYFWAKLRDGSTLLYKVGQSPELEERVPKALSEKLDADDLKAYRNAIRTRNFNFGIAAVTYMRRVVENKMNDMLEVLHEAARNHNAPEAVLARHQEVMQERKFSVKVDYAGDLLPEKLRPKGQPNPMAILHHLASEGLHAKTDAECIDIFDKCRQTFEYVFGKMSIEVDEAKKFVSEISQLAKGCCKTPVF